MPHADLHGSTIAIETGDGGKTTFELGRLGTAAEFETVKAALETAKQDIAGMDAEIVRMVEKERATTQRLSNADAAYKEAKEANTEGSKQLAELRAEVARLTELAYVQGAREGLTEREHREGIVRDFQKISREKNDLRSELENLRSDKESLEEADAELRSELASVKAKLDVVAVERDDASEKLDAAAELGATLSDQRDESRASFDTLRTQMLDFLGEERTGIEAVVQLLEKLAGE